MYMYIYIYLIHVYDAYIYIYVYIYICIYVYVVIANLWRRAGSPLFGEPRGPGPGHGRLGPEAGCNQNIKILLLRL